LKKEDIDTDAVGYILEVQPVKSGKARIANDATLLDVPLPGRGASRKRKGCAESIGDVLACFFLLLVEYFPARRIQYVIVLGKKKCRFARRARYRRYEHVIA